MITTKDPIKDPIKDTLVPLRTNFNANGSYLFESVTLTKILVIVMGFVDMFEPI